MLVTSKDVFWFAFAFVILWVGIFMGWGAFYFAMILRDMQKMTGSIKKKLDILDQILNVVKKKTEATASYLPLLIEGVQKLVQAFAEKKKSSSSKSKKRS